MKKQKQTIEDGTFKDAVKNIKNVVKEGFKLVSIVAIFSLFFITILVVIIAKGINNDNLYASIIVFLFMFASLLVYLKDKSAVSSIVTFIIGAIAAFSVTWNFDRFLVLVLSFSIFSIILFLLTCVFLAAKYQSISYQIYNLYIGSFEENKRDIDEVFKIIKKQKGSLANDNDLLWEMIAFLSQKRIPKDRMIELLKEINVFYTITKLNYKKLQTFIININALASFLEDFKDKDFFIIMPIFYHLTAHGRYSFEDFVDGFNHTIYFVFEGKIEYMKYFELLDGHLSRGYPYERIEKMMEGHK